MRRSARVMVCLVGSALVPGGAPCAQDLAVLVRQAEALGARTGIVVRDLSGGVRFERRANEFFAPASNLKLLTAAAVLRGLGDEHAFATRFELQQGRLVVHAGGDPNLISGTEHAPERVFAAVAEALRARGITAVRGIDLVAGAFQGPDRPATWPTDQLDRPYCAPTGGLVLEQGTFSVRVAPGQGSAQCELVAPPAALPIRGSIALVTDRRAAVWGALDLGDAIKVQGRFLRTAGPATGTWAVRDPAGWFGATLRAVLERAGIGVDPAAPAADGEVHVHRSPLRPALARCLLDSSNFDAEQLLRALGASTRGDGSLAGGMLAMAEQLRGLVGNLPPGTELVDGSGLSRGNRVSPALVAEVLRAALRGPGAATFLAGLPVGGESGTLNDRFRRSAVAGRVHAKTGWIRGASALSGYVRSPSGDRSFAILMNYDRDQNGLNRDLKALQEKMVEAIDALPEGDVR